MIDQLLKEGVLRKSADGRLVLAAELQSIEAASAAHFDSLDKWGTNWIATGWSVDLANNRPSLFVFPIQGDEIPPDTEFRKALRPDVNEYLKIDPRQITGFSVSFSPRANK